MKRYGSSQSSPGGSFTNNPFYVIHGVDGTLDLTAYSPYAKQIEFVGGYQSWISPQSVVLPAMPLLEVFYYSGSRPANYITTLDFSVGMPRLYQLIVTNEENAEIALSNLPGLKILNISSTGITQLLLNGNNALEEVSTVLDNQQLTAIDLNGKTNLKRVLNITQNSLLVSVNLNGCSALKEAHMNQNPSLNIVDLTSCSLLENLTISGSSALTTLDISSCPLLLNCNLTNNNLTAAACSQICIDLDNFGLSNGEILLAGGTNAPFATWTVAGQTAVSNLIGKGWVGSAN